MSCGIYYITNMSSNKKYVGESANLETRYMYHLNDLRGNRHKNDLLQEDFNIFGESNFTFLILEYCDDNLLYEREIFWILQMDTLNNGYNETTGGRSGTEYSKRTKDKMSRAKVGKYEGENNPYYGKHHNEEIRKIMSLKAIERFKNEDAPMKGRTHTEETRVKISEALKGKPSPRKGAVLTEETKIKISESKKGKLSPKKIIFSKKDIQNMIKLRANEVSYSEIARANNCDRGVITRAITK